MAKHDVLFTILFTIESPYLYVYAKQKKVRKFGPIGKCFIENFCEIIFFTGTNFPGIYFSIIYIL